MQQGSSRQAGASAGVFCKHSSNSINKQWNLYIVAHPVPFGTCTNNPSLVYTDLGSNPSVEHELKHRGIQTGVTSLITPAKFPVCKRGLSQTMYIIIMHALEVLYKKLHQIHSQLKVQVRSHHHQCSTPGSYSNGALIMNFVTEHTQY